MLVRQCYLLLLPDDVYDCLFIVAWDFYEKKIITEVEAHQLTFCYGEKKSPVAAQSVGGRTTYSSSNCVNCLKNFKRVSKYSYISDLMLQTGYLEQLLLQYIAW